MVDIRALHAALGIPVLVVSRRTPDLAAIRRALLEQVAGGARKVFLTGRSMAKLERASASIIASKEDDVVHCVPCDVTNEQAVESL